MKNIFKKWKLYNSFKYTLIPKNTISFFLELYVPKAVNSSPKVKVFIKYDS